MSNERIVVGLDIGSTKVSTVIGEVAGDGVLDIIGEGTVPAEVLRRGAVVNLDQTIQAVKQSLGAAQRVAGVEATDVWISVSGDFLRSLSSHGIAAIRRGQQITRADIERTVENARAVPLGDDQEVLHVLPQQFVVDGNDGIEDPTGMTGVRLEADVHMVFAQKGPLENLRRCVEEAGVVVNGIVVESLASGLAVLTRHEQDLSTLVVDFGGGATNYGLFTHGILAKSGSLSIGGNAVTSDIAQILSLPPDEAERVKLRYGVAIPDLADHDVELEVASPSKTVTISTFQLAQIIQPRVAEIFDLVKREVEANGTGVEFVANNVVITGGAALMPGVAEVAEDRFGLPARIGRPEDVSGLADVVASPIHAAAVGLVRYGEELMPEMPFAERPVRRAPVRNDDDEQSGERIGSRLRKFFKDFF